MKAFIFILLLSASAFSETCYDKWRQTGIETSGWLNQSALREKLLTTTECATDLNRLHTYSKSIWMKLDVEKMARCVAGKVKARGPVSLGLTKTQGDYLPRGCSIPAKVYENSEVAAKFLECRDGDFKKKVTYLPNRLLKCGANYCFLMKVDQMLDNDLNNCPACVELRKFIEAAPLLSLDPGDVLVKAMELTDNNLSEALLISYYSLGHDWIRPEEKRNLDYFQASLKSMNPLRSWKQDNFGPWYHFFGTAFFALSHESVNLTFIGSLVAELVGDIYNFRALDPNELRRDLQGAKFLGEFLKEIKRPQSYGCEEYYSARPL